MAHELKLENSLLYRTSNMKPTGIRFTTTEGDTFCRRWSKSSFTTPEPRGTTTGDGRTTTRDRGAGAMPKDVNARAG